ncbi:MAG: NrtA/SsuA/CpmA family ABC transporter substrate-binding protein, partial [Betaproteobacteria bacterium]
RNESMHKKLIVLVVALLVTCGAVASWYAFRTGGNDSVVRIGYTPLLYAQPTFVALEKHYFEELGLQVEVTRFENSTQIVNAVISGDLDFCAITPALSVFAAEEKLDQKDSQFKLVYYNLDSREHPISFLLVKKDSAIATLGDLKGKTIGVFPGNILSRTSAKLLLKDLMDVERDVVFQDVAPQLQAQALDTNQVDAMFSLEPFATISLEKGVAKILYVAPQLSISEPLPGGCGMMSTRFSRERPDVARKFVQALEKAGRTIREDPAFALNILPKYTPLTPEIALKVRQPEYHVAGEQDVKLLQQEYDALLKEGILNRPLDVKRLIYQGAE